MEIEGTDGYQILRTSDGARSWMDVTDARPKLLSRRIWDCQFPKTNLAWMSFCEGGKTSLLLTTNGGESWAPWAPLGSFDNSTHNFFLRTESCRFLDDSNGLAMDMDAGACQATYTFFETHDGGLTWKPAMFSGKYPIAGEPPGMIWGSDCDGSAVSYYPPKTIVIAQGDLGDEKPKGVVRFSLSSDSGKSWRDLAFPLPEKYHDRLVQSLPPHFFDASNAVLPVCMLKDTTDGFTDGILVFYSTSDGGNTWSARQGIVNANGNFFDGDCDYVSPKDIYINTGAGIYATHDGGDHWQLVWASPRFEIVNGMDFTDAAHGWLFVGDKRTSSLRNSLYKTSDGGKTWTQLPIIISDHSLTSVTAR